ncbi:MAG: family 10 glycosylhydrolase [Ignavibacteriaceae bacterium]
MKIILTFLLVINFIAPIEPQSLPLKRELRAVWVATVTNIDWPTSKTLTPPLQRYEIINLLNKHQANGMNCIMLQIRATCDAFFMSPYEPWSEWLTGTQGLAPSPVYDPLIFWIDEAHKRGIEVHAWFNPYRAVMNKNTSSVANSHISVTTPQWVHTYGNYKWLDPGIPDVVAYDTKVIIDVVKRYDIDGVHFDDYFYPYPISGVPFPDSITYAQYGGGYDDLGNWRRNNVNTLIQMLSDSIKHYKKHVKFGISPFGIWRNKSTDSTGSNTNGFQAYDAQFADSKLWVQAGWLDYINPQIYWSIGYPAARYEVLAEWWADNSYGKHLYIGQAAYKILNNADTNWNNLSEMPSHLRLNQMFPEIKGNVFFSSKSITNNFGGIQDSLRNNFYKYPALPPIMEWKDSIPPLPPTNLILQKDSNKVLVSWEKQGSASDGDTARYFIVYRFTFPDTVNIQDPRAIRKIIYTDSKSFQDTIGTNMNSGFYYAVTSVDRMHNESKPVVGSTNITGVGEDAGIADNFALEQNYPNPFNPSTFIVYSLEFRGEVSLRIYDILGNEVARLVEEKQEAGRHEVSFDGSRLPSGVYFYELRAGSYVSTKKMVLLK